MKLQPSAATPLGLHQVAGSVGRALFSDALSGFEAELARKLGMQDSVALSSLMRTTFVAVEAAQHRCRPGASIILPRYSCPSFIHGIKAAAMPHRYCDNDPASLTVQPEAILRAADESVGAVLVPNLFGLSADMRAIAELCRSRGWLLLEGADYTLGGRFGGRPLGSYGDITILNFQEGKALPVGGGMALSRDAGAFDAWRQGPRSSTLLAWARASAYSVLIRPWGYGLFSRLIAGLGVAKKSFSMEDTIRDTRTEFDYAVDTRRLTERISEFQGALGSSILARLPEHVARRRENAARLEESLAGIPGLTLIPRHPDLDCCHYIRYPVLVGLGRRDELCRRLVQAGFEASPMYVEHGMNIDANAHPGAARICAELLTLPCHPLMRTSDLLHMAGIIRNQLRH